ncbi:MAG: hypothetical protein OXG68_13805 [Chloroflexi bacterium]|nr:hypothetical protein [Chloroflexota bacterium]
MDTERRIVEVALAKGRGKTHWTSPGIEIHTRFLQKMRQILLSDADFVYMNERARLRRGIARRAAQRVSLATTSILPLADGRFLVFPWCGTRQFATLVHWLGHCGFGVSDQDPPYCPTCGSSCGASAKIPQLPRRSPSP